MSLEFRKMHGAGNDFIVFDNTDGKIELTKEYISSVCHRRRGVGGDGMIALIKAEPGNKDYDAVMEYYNSDGSRGEMCGNGLRCAAYFAYTYLDVPAKMKVSTDAGILEAEILGKNKVKISIPLIEEFRELEIDGQKMYHGNTGVPHTVVPVKDLAEYKVFANGRKLRYDKAFPNGSNVNFIEYAEKNGTVNIRTYERGVEDETFACGTGICASAISLKLFEGFSNKIVLKTVDNDILEVELEELENNRKVYLSGPAEIAFKGIL